MTVGVVVLLDAWVHVWIDTGVNAGVHGRIQQALVTWSSLHGSNHSNILHRWVRAVIVVVVLVVLWVVEVGVVKLRLLLEVLVLLLLEVVVVQKLWLVANSSGGGGSGSSISAATVQRLLHQGSGVLSSLLLAANHGKVWLRRVVVSWVDHSQDPHLRVLLVVLVAVKLVGLLLHLLGLLLLRWVQVGHQPVATLGSLGVSNSLSLGGVLDSGSERARSLTLEVHRLGLGGVDHNLALLLLVENGLDILDQLLLAGESLDDVALTVSRHEVPTVLVVNSGSWEPTHVLVLGHLLLLQVLLVQLLLQVLLVQRVLLQVLVLQVLVLQVLLLQVLLLQLLLLLHLRSGGTQVDATVVLAIVVVVAHHSWVGEVVPVSQGNGGGSGVVQLLVVEVLLLEVLVLRG